MNNKVIKVLDEEHGKRVIEFWKKHCDTGSLAGNNPDCYYGIIDGTFHLYDIDEVQASNAQIILLPEDSTYPRVMLVSDDNMNWDNKRVVFMEKCGGFLAWEGAETLKEAENETSTIFWKYAKEIGPVEVTIEEIAEWKGVSKNQITIKQ